MQRSTNLTVIITTLNEDENIRDCIESASGIENIFIVDSYSTDRTVEIAKEYPNVTIYYYQKDCGSNLKNWALDNLPIKTEWVFVLDADERITDSLKQELFEVTNTPQIKESGFFVNRRFVFMGRWLKHGGLYPVWNLRLFRFGTAKYELRNMDEHVIIDGDKGYLKNDLIHEDKKDLRRLIKRHNKFSSLEALDVFNLAHDKSDSNFRSSFFGDPIARKRAVREKIWYRLPFRPLIFLLYSYVVRFGFLDGYEGFSYIVFKSYYQFLINLKLKELVRKKEAKKRCSWSF